MRLVERSLELLEAAVLGQHQVAVIDERPVGSVAAEEVLGVLTQHVVSKYNSDAQLVATPEVQVNALGVECARSEAGVERRLVAVVVHAVARWLFEHGADAIGAAARRHRRGGQAARQTNDR